MADADKRHLVFVSHATYDRWIAIVLCEKLTALGDAVRVFRDDLHIDGGSSILETIKEKIRESDELLVLLTPESIKREWVLLEIGMAEILGKRIVPVLYHVVPEQVPSILKDRRAYHLNESDLGLYLDSVRERIVTR